MLSVKLCQSILPRFNRVILFINDARQKPVELRKILAE